MPDLRVSDYVARNKALQAKHQTYQSTTEGRSVLERASANIPAIGDESNSALLFDLYINQNVDYNGYRELFNQYAQLGPQAFGGIAAGTAGAPADIMAMAVALGYNFLNMAQGGEFTWPEEWESIPGTTDFLGDLMGLDPNDPAFMMASFAGLDPFKPMKQGIVAGEKALHSGLRGFINSTLRASKALQGHAERGYANLNRAKQMLQDATGGEWSEASVFRVWRETGWYMNRDRKWRFYLSDADSKVNREALARNSRTPHMVRDQHGRIGRLGDWQINEVRTVATRAEDLLSHDALFELYPSLRGVQIQLPVRKIGDDSYKLYTDLFEMQGYANLAARTIHATTLKKGELHGFILHELQHMVQNIEGFSNGANLDWMLREAAGYRLNRILTDMATDPNHYIGLEPEEIESILKWANPEFKKADLVDELPVDSPEWEEARKWSEDLQTLMGFVDDALDNNLSEDELVALYGAVSHSAHNITRYLNEATMRGYGQDVKDWMMSADPMDVFTLAKLRYDGALGEAEARLVEALVRVKQENIDNLLFDPQWAFNILGSRGARQVLPGVKTPRDPVRKSDTFLEPEFLRDDSSRPQATTAKPMGEIINDPSRGGVTQGGGLDVPGDDRRLSWRAAHGQELPEGTHQEGTLEELFSKLKGVDEGEITKTRLLELRERLKKDPLLDAIYGPDLDRKLSLVLGGVHERAN